MTTKQEAALQAITDFDQMRESEIVLSRESFLMMGKRIAELEAVNQQLLEFAKWVLSLKTGGMIEGKARAAIAAAEKEVRRD